MNAYELADELIRTPYEPIKGDCASMLRQQADRIMELEQFWKDCEEDRTKKCSDCQSAEPVATMWTRGGKPLGMVFNEKPISTFLTFEGESFVGIPLYTTPQIKELSDEEILEVWRENERVYPMDRSRLLDRTRACIKKASEK